MRSLAVLFFLSARRARLFHSRGGSPFHLLRLLFLLLCSLCMLFQVVDIDKRREKRKGEKKRKKRHPSIGHPPSIYLVIESVRLGYRQYINVHPSVRSTHRYDMIRRYDMLIQHGSSRIAAAAAVTNPSEYYNSYPLCSRVFYSERIENVWIPFLFLFFYYLIQFKMIRNQRLSVSFWHFDYHFPIQFFLFLSGRGNCA